MTEKLVFDLGARRGEDTGHYLRRGCRVVAVEANPELLPQLRERFREAIGAGDVVVVGRAIGERDGRIKFAITPGHDVFGTTDQRFVERFEKTTGKQADWVEIEATTLPRLFETYGVPYYMKVDLEGLDRACIEALVDRAEVPEFVSVESVVTSPGASVGALRRELSRLRAAGYARFQFVEQAYLGLTAGRVLSGEGPPLRYEYEEGASGPFGSDLPGRWRRAGPTFVIGVILVGRYHLLGHEGRLTRSRGARLLRRSLRLVGRMTKRRRFGALLWYDLHAGR